MSEQEPQSEIIPASLAGNSDIETVHQDDNAPEPVKELSAEEAYVESCQRVNALEAELKEAKAENAELAFANSKENRQLTLAECNAISKECNRAIDKDRMAAANYAASRGLVMAPALVSSPTARLPVQEGK